MQLSISDWVVVFSYAVIALVVGLYFTRRAGGGRQEFFLAGRKLPWWLLGTSMVATTFSTDTPNLVTDLVRNGGVSQNWVWWAFLLTGMLTVFFYARLWRRSGALTDVGFYELRYSGKPAAFLRGFRAVYLGLFLNVVIMASVTLAAIKIGGVLLGTGKYETVFVAGSITAIYSMTSGLWGVVATDLLLFAISMTGAVTAAFYAVRQPEVGGLSGLFTHPAVADKLSFLPDFSDWKTAAAVFVIPLAVQWWATWYPGSEPGGGGYVAQRMLAAKNEKEAMFSTLWFNIAHYSLRPWPWIVVALASIIVYPTLGSIAAQFPNVDPSIVKHDLAYPAMLALIPHGLLGLVIASLGAAYMSTISTHLNWGSSYMVDDVYRRFINPEADERHYVLVARVSTVILIVLASALSLVFENAKQVFDIILQIGAGTGLVFLLRWFWWRINAWSEISAMIISLLVVVYFQFIHLRLGLAPLDSSVQLVIGVGITTVVWLAVTFLTRPTDPNTLRSFVEKIRPAGRGWRAVKCDSHDVSSGRLSAGVLGWFLGCTTVYSALFGTGFVLYGEFVPGVVSLTVTALAGWGLMRTLPRTDALG